MGCWLRCNAKNGLYKGDTTDLQSMTEGEVGAYKNNFCSARLCFGVPCEPIQCFVVQRSIRKNFFADWQNLITHI